MSPLETSLSLDKSIDRFLADLLNANRSQHTVRNYRIALTQFADVTPVLTSEVALHHVQAFLDTLSPLRPATRALKQSALTSFFDWALRARHLDTNPMQAIQRVRLDDPKPRALQRHQIEKILTLIPRHQIRDRLLFRLLFEIGLRVSEALALVIEDLDLTLDNEHISVLGKGGRRRLVLLDDPTLVTLLRRYLAQTQYRSGSLFRATKNGRGGSIRYQSIHEHWMAYCRSAAVTCTLHQLRHSHATELVTNGVSLATIRKRLGHKNLQTTLRYAEQSDDTADAELRAWPRKQIRNR